MKYALTVNEIKAIDINAQYLGITKLQLMENAGAEIARKIKEKVNIKGKKVLIIAGRGDKGGDGFVAARHLSRDEVKTTVILIGDSRNIRSIEARKNWKILENMESSVELIVFKDKFQEDLLEEKIIESDVIVDAILGTGIKGSLKPPITTIIEKINQARLKGKYIVSIDIPTGLDPNTGEILGEAVMANLTITHHKLKRGLTVGEANKYAGEITVSNIGIPLEAELFAGPGDVLIVEKKRKPISHKGEYGRIIVVGGSVEYTGAPALTALAALKTGADVVKIMTPDRVADIIRSYTPNLIVSGYSGNYLNLKAIEQILSEAEKSDTIVIGPGLGLNERTVEASIRLIERLKHMEKNLVIDADALKACKRKTEILRGDRIMITPHQGEFKTITGIELPSEENGGWINRMKIVKEEALKLEVTILLKSHYDIISDGRRIKVNRTGNPGMTVGGTGDVLAGIAATIFTWCEDSFKAATAAAFINGLAGDLAVKEKGYHITATDVLDKIPDAFKEIEKYIEI